MQTITLNSYCLKTIREYLTAVGETAKQAKDLEGTRAAAENEPTLIKNASDQLQRELDGLPDEIKAKLASAKALDVQASAAERKYRQAYNAKFEKYGHNYRYEYLYETEFKNWSALQSAASSARYELKKEPDYQVVIRAEEQLEKHTKELARLHGVKSAGEKRLANLQLNEEKAKSAMTPAEVPSLPIEFLRDIATFGGSTYQLDLWMQQPEETVPELSSREWLAIVRGEIEHHCDCKNGYVYFHFAHKTYPIAVRVLFEDEVRHTWCHARSQYQPRKFDAMLASILPARHQHHRLWSLKPFEKNPVSLDTQETLIKGVQSFINDYDGWLLTGPGGTSKTTYVAAALIDTLTFRAYQANRERIDSKNLCAWRIKVPDWLDEMEAWKTRDFEDRSAKPPDLTAKSIQESSAETGLTPILWLEELDKFGPTLSRRKYLYSLIDAVYEANGTIIATTNMSRKQLEAHIDTDDFPICRRVTGQNDDPERFMVWELGHCAGGNRPGEKVKKVAKSTITA